MNRVDTTASSKVIKNFSSQTFILAQRSLISELRQLATVLPGLLFPLLLAFLAALRTSGLGVVPWDVIRGPYLNPPLG